MMRPTTTNAFDVNAFFVAVGSERRITHYRKRQIIFSQGDESDSIFYIEKGHVKLSVVSAEGKEAIVSVCDGGSFFGESCIESDCPVRFHSVVALTKVDLVRIERAAILHLLNELVEPLRPVQQLRFRHVRPSQLRHAAQQPLQAVA